MRSRSGGRHENGQNLLVDDGVVRDVVDLVSRTDGAILEIGPGDGAITRRLDRLCRDVTAVELDAGLARRVDASTSRRTTVVVGDVLTHPLPTAPHTVVGNLPFHLTTAVLRRLLGAPGWQDAVLLVQWEVARRRAGVGGATLMTAQWWPWFDVRLHRRIPARAFRPVPGVDGGLLSLHRRARPLVTERVAYQRFSRQVFTGRGLSLVEVITRATTARRADVVTWALDERLPAGALPRDLTAEQWASLWRVVRR